jgi:hypothetical protein
MTNSIAGVGRKPAPVFAVEPGLVRRAVVLVEWVPDLMSRTLAIVLGWMSSSTGCQLAAGADNIGTGPARQLAFAGAKGYGRFAPGGCCGRVIEVTNLNDSSPGSLRAAIEAEGPRTVVFSVSGLITLESRLIIRNPFLTIAGQTAPGKGVCIRKYNLSMMGARDVIVRYLRVRPGNISGMTLDGMGMASSDDCIIDHCSISSTWPTRPPAAAPPPNAAVNCPRITARGLTGLFSIPS